MAWSKSWTRFTMICNFLIKTGCSHQKLNPSAVQMIQTDAHPPNHSHHRQRTVEPHGSEIHCHHDGCGCRSLRHWHVGGCGVCRSYHDYGVRFHHEDVDGGLLCGDVPRGHGTDQSHLVDGARVHNFVHPLNR